MLEKILSCVIIISLIMTSAMSITGFAASSNDGTVYTDSWVPGVDNGQSGDAGKLSVETVSENGESYYLYTSVNGKSDAPLIYKARTVALSEMTFMLTDSGSKVLYMPVFYDKAKGGENWNPVITVSEAGGVVIANIKDASGNSIFSEAEDGWSGGKYTLSTSVSMNKKHTIRVEHNPDELKFTVRFNGQTAVLAENAESAFVVSTQTGSADARNSKGPRFAFAASSGQSFRVYDLYLRGTVAGNTNADKAALVFDEAKEYSYEGQLRLVSTYPEDGSYGIDCAEKELTLTYNEPLSESFADDFKATVSYAKNGEEPTELLPDEFLCSIDAENSTVKITLLENMKKGVTYTVKIENIYSAEGNPLYESEFSFTSDDGTKEILDAVNSASGIRNLGQVLNDYQDDIGLKDADYSDYNSNRNVISWVLKNKPYTDIADIKATAENAEAMKSELDLCDENTVGAFALDYADVLFDDMAAIEKYSSLSGLYLAMANSMIAGKMPFATLIDFAGRFEECVNSISVESDSGVQSAERLICDFTLTGTEGWAPSKAEYTFITESKPDFAHGKTLGRYYISETTTNQYRMDFKLDYKNVTDCDTIYIWAYSPKNTGNEYALVVYCGTNEAGQWVDFRKVMKVDFEGWKLMAIPFSSFTKTRNPTWDRIEEIRFAQAGMGITEAIGGTEIYFAKMWFGNSVPTANPEVVYSNVFDGTMGFGIGDAAEFEFSENVYLNPGNVPYIVDSEGKRIEADVNLSANILTILPEEPLKEDSSYTVYLSGLADASAKEIPLETHAFTTSSKGLYASVPQFSASSLPDSGSVCAAVSLGNSLDVTQTAELIVVAYNENGRMVSVSSGEKSIEPGEREQTLLCYIDLDSYEGITLKAFVVNKSDNSKPIGKKTAVLKSDSTPGDKVFESFEKTASFADGSLGINNISVDIDTITVESCVLQNATDTLVVKVFDEANNLKFTAQTSADARGCATVEFTLDSAFDEGGKYTVEVSSASMTNKTPAKGYFYYLDNASKSKILKMVNSASSEKKVAEILNTEKTMMSLPFVDYTDSENMYISHVIYRDAPYSSYNEVVEKFNAATKAYEAINKSYWSAYGDIMEEYKDIIFDNESIYTKFARLSNSQKNKAAQKVHSKAPFEDFEEFANAISDATDDLDSGSGGSGSSGGSGGGSSAPTGGYTATQPQTLPTVTPDNGTYTDLDGALWAENYIYDLKNKGVLTMGADRKFRPNDNITREEFVKMLVCALGISAPGEVSFKDVSRDSWYYTYVAAAFNSGIVNGIDAKHFGVGELITREQMAAMATRALGITDFETGTEAFADDSEISDYAKAPVYYMQEKGIINGMGENTFAPKANASRAQAAKIISLISEL